MLTHCQMVDLNTIKLIVVLLVKFLHPTSDSMKENGHTEGIQKFENNSGRLRPSALTHIADI